MELHVHRSLWMDVWLQFRHHTGALLGVAVFMIIVLAVVIGPYVHDVDPQFLDIKDRNQGPSLAHPFGTDNLDVTCSRKCWPEGVFLWPSVSPPWRCLWWSHRGGSGGRVLQPAGWSADAVDRPVSGVTAASLAAGDHPAVPGYVTHRVWTGNRYLSADRFVIGITSWMQTARIVRGDVLALKEREFVTAARSIGTRERRIITRHVLPNVLSPIMVSATLGIANAIITESALSFLGLGFPPDFPTWGRLLFDGANFMTISPSRVIWPGLAISLTVLSVNYIGDGLRDALDPRLRS